MTKVTEKIRTILLHNADQASNKQRFFKTGKGEYAENDVFIGVRVPDLRKIAKCFHSLAFDDLQALIESDINEERFLALIILVIQYNKSAQEKKESIYRFYVDNIKHVNNWNLVDASAHLILGAHLSNADRSLLFTLAKSDVMWERRISIVSTWHFIKNGDLELTFQIALILINDKHDLIHKAAGWMLREAGKKNQPELIRFLEKYSKQMPRTMLRYSMERLK